MEQLDADHPSNNGWRIVSLGALPHLKYHSVPAARDRNDVTFLPLSQITCKAWHVIHATTTPFWDSMTCQRSSRAKII